MAAWHRGGHALAAGIGLVVAGGLGMISSYQTGLLLAGLAAAIGALSQMTPRVPGSAEPMVEPERADSPA
jgi:hypothetical protein